MAKTNLATVDEYIAACPEESHAKLQEIRAAIKAAVPNAKEKISYQIGAFELNGRGARLCGLEKACFAVPDSGGE